MSSMRSRPINAVPPDPSTPDPPAGTGDRALERALGARIRGLRRNLDLSVADLAGAARISTGMLSKIENGQISPSLSTVQSIAGALGLPIATLFTVGEDRLHCSYVRANEGVTIERRGSKLGHAYELLGHVLGGDVVVEPYLITLKDDAVPHTAFQHAGLELIYMLSGEVAYRHDDAVYDLRPGDTLLFDSGALHGPQQFKTRPVSYLSIIIYARLQENGRPARPPIQRAPRAASGKP